MKLPIEFYSGSVIDVAKRLLGCTLVSKVDGSRVSGRIVEVEAYLPTGDSACHAARGKTPSNRSMFGAPGIAYVYPIHAKYCFNVVCEDEGQGSAVLIRAVEPLTGIATMEGRRNTDRLRDLARGPSRLCQAFRIDRSFDAIKLTTGRKLWLEGHSEDDIPIGMTPRIGVTSAEEMKLRFIELGSAFASCTRKLNDSAEKI